MLELQMGEARRMLSYVMSSCESVRKRKWEKTKVKIRKTHSRDGDWVW
jgi:hypothetical protein